MKAAIVGIAGPHLTPTEAALFRAHPPAGVILFARNIADPPQLAALTTALRRTLPPTAILMVDQEGGRVARLRPPHWPAHPPAAALGTHFAHAPAAALRAAWLTGALIGLDCAAAGFEVAAAPVLDLRLPGAHAVIGDRALANPQQPSPASAEPSPPACSPPVSNPSASTPPATAAQNSTATSRSPPSRPTISTPICSPSP